MPVGADSFAEALRCGAEIFHALKSKLHGAGLSTASSELPAASSFVLRFVRHWRVCSLIPPRTTWPVAGSIGPTADR